MVRTRDAGKQMENNKAKRGVGAEECNSEDPKRPATRHGASLATKKMSRISLNSLDLLYDDISTKRLTFVRNALICKINT